MATINILYGQTSVKTQVIRNGQVQKINAALGDHFVINNSENATVTTKRVGDDLQIFLDNGKKPALVLQDYFQTPALAPVELHTGTQEFVYQASASNWVPANADAPAVVTPAHELSSTLTASDVAGGSEIAAAGASAGGAAAGVSPLIWGLGAVAVVGGGVAAASSHYRSVAKNIENEAEKQSQGQLGKDANPHSTGSQGAIPQVDTSQNPTDKSAKNTDPTHQTSPQTTEKTATKDNKPTGDATHKMDSKPDGNATHKTDNKPVGDATHKTDSKPDGDATHKTDSKPDGDATHKTDNKPDSDATHKTDSKPTGDATHKTDSKPDGDATHKTDSKPDGDATHKTDSKPDGDATHKTDSKPDGDATHRTDSKPDGDATHKTDSKPDGNATHKTDSKPDGDATHKMDSKPDSDATHKTDSKPTGDTDGHDPVATKPVAPEKPHDGGAHKADEMPAVKPEAPTTPPKNPPTVEPKYPSTGDSHTNGHDPVATKPVAPEKPHDGGAHKPDEMPAVKPEAPTNPPKNPPPVEPKHPSTGDGHTDGHDPALKPVAPEKPHDGGAHKADEMPAVKPEAPTTLPKNPPTVEPKHPSTGDGHTDEYDSVIPKDVADKINKALTAGHVVLSVTPSEDAKLLPLSKEFMLHGNAQGVEKDTPITIHIGDKSFQTHADGQGGWQLHLNHEQTQGLSAGLQNVRAEISNGKESLQSGTQAFLVAPPAPSGDKDAHTEGQPVVTAGENAGTKTGFTVVSKGQLTLSGDVKNMGDDAEVFVSYGNHIQRGTVSNNKWSVTLPAEDLQSLPEDKSTIYHVVVTDSTGKSASAESHFTMDLQPNVTIHVPEKIDVSKDLSIPIEAGDLHYGHHGYSYVVRLNGKEYTADKQHFITDNSHLTVNIPAADLAQLASGKHDIRFGFANSIEQKYDFVTKTIVIPSSHDATLLTVDTIAKDRVVDATEHGQHLTLTGDAQNVSDLTLTLNGKTYHPTIHNGTWSVDIPQGDVSALNDGHSYIVSLTGHDKNGQAVAARAGVAVDIDVVLNVDHPVNDGLAVQLHGMARNVADGNVVQIEINDQRYSTTAHNGEWSLQLAPDAVPANATINISADGHSTQRTLASQNNVLTTDNDTTRSEAERYLHTIQKTDHITGVPDSTHAHLPTDGSGIADSEVHALPTRVIEDNLSALNAFRSFNKLDPVTASPNMAFDNNVAKGLMVLARDDKFSHELANNGHKYAHYDAEGEHGTMNAVIFKTFGGGLDTSGTISGYISDDHNVHAGAGHRIQLLSPSLIYSSVTATHDGASQNAIYSGMQTLAGDLVDKNAYLPKTLEWPAAGYMPYSLMPKKTWTFATNEASKDEEVRSITVERTDSHGNVTHFTVNPSEIDNGDYATQPLIDNDRPYQMVLGFPALPGGTSSGNPNLPRPDGVDKYNVHITTDRHQWQYTVNVFDETASLHKANAGKFSPPHVDVPAAEHTHAATGADAAPSVDSVHVATGADATPSVDSVHAATSADAAPSVNNVHAATAANAAPSVDSVHAATGADATADNAPQVSAGNDTIHLGNVNMTFDMGYGDDWLLMDHYQGGQVNGGAGTDTLSFNAGSNVTNLSHFSNFEHIDLGNFASEHSLGNVLNIQLDDLLDNHDANGQLWIEGGAGNKIALSGGTVDAITEVQKDGHSYHDISYHHGSTGGHIIVADDLFLNGEGIVIL